jgi:nicotinamide-nucleotide amidase
MNAEIIAVGSEMLTPDRQDTNSLFVTAGLNELGVSVAFKTIVGDNRRHLTDAIGIALRRADIVVLSGGLGPTEDDLTRECVADALSIELHRDPALLVELQKRFVARRIAMPPNNERQTEVLDGATILPNRNGSAPGQFLDTVLDGHRKVVILLPGPPKELMPLFDEQCKPRLAATLPERHLARRQLRMALVPESTVDARSAPIYKRFTDVETTILAARGEISLHFVCTKPTREAADRRVDEVADLVAHEMGDDVFSANGEPLEEIVILMLGMQNLTLAVAESLTGGWLSQRLTSVVNASRAFHGGAVVYANEQKANFCNVAWELIQQHGAVSEPVARALAEGIRETTKCSLGLSLTGIAGPAVGEGPDAGKPVGLVYVGLASAEGTQVRQLNLAGDREHIRLWSTQHGLEMVRRFLL